ncbi:MAG TPA: hypothetical protein VIL49_13670 [Capillimicrobium sp.]
MLSTALATAVVALSHGGAPDTVTISGPAQARPGVPLTLIVDVQTAHEEARLVVIRRPASGPPCAADNLTDYGLVPGGPASDRVYVTEQAVRIAAPGRRVELTDTIDRPGRYRLCAWLEQRIAADPPYATGSAEIEVAAGEGDLRVALRQRGGTPAAAAVSARLSGTSDAPGLVRAHLQPEGRPCPERPISEYDNTNLRADSGDSTAVGPGAFALVLHSQRPVPQGRWRACGYLMPMLGDEPAAAASDVLSTTFKPVNFTDAPVNLTAPGDGVLRCTRGGWAGRPAPRFAWRWTRNGKTVGRRQTIRVPRSDRWGRYRCYVIARNSAGRAEVGSRTEAQGYHAWPGPPGR